MQILLLVLLLCFLAGCSDDGSGFDVVDAHANKTSIQNLEVEYFGVDMGNNREEVCSSIFFVRDSVALECLDSSFNVVSRVTEYDAVINREQIAVFKDLDLKSPYVELVEYGRIVKNSGVDSSSIPVELRNLMNALNKDTAKFDAYSGDLVSGRLRRYLEENFPFHIAETMAKKELNQFLKSKNLAADFIFCNAFNYPNAENVQSHLDKFQSTFATDSLFADAFVLNFMDSLLAANSVVSESYIDYLVLAYDLKKCSYLNYVDSIKNMNSLFYGRYLYCDSSQWRITSKDSLPFICGMYNKNDVRLTGDSTLVACNGLGSWDEVSFAEPYITKFLGNCDSSEVSVDTLGNKVFCASDGRWYLYENEVERNIGICGVSAKYDSLAEYQGVYYLCEKSKGNQGMEGNWTIIDANRVKMEASVGKCGSTVSAGTILEYVGSIYYCETDSKQWREANYREIMLFENPMGGNCDRESDHIQIVNISGEGYWMCVDYPVGNIAYGWTRLDSKNHKELTTYFSDEFGESTKVVAVDLSTKVGDYNYCLYLNEDKDDSSLYGVVYSEGFYRAVETESKVILDGSEGVAAQGKCPIGFEAQNSLCVKVRESL